MAVGSSFFGIRPEEALQWRRLWWEEGGVGRGLLTKTVRRGGGVWCLLLLPLQFAQLVVSFVSPGWFILKTTKIKILD